MSSGACPLKTERCVVADAGPLIHLDELGAVELLSDFGTVYVTPTVWLEAIRHRPGLQVERPWLSISEPASRPTSSFRALVSTLGLHRGEVSALLLCQDFETALFLCDDSAARIAAEALGFTAHGTLGILMRSMRRGSRSKAQVLSMLRSIPSSSTLHIRTSLLEEIIRKAQEYEEL